MTNRKIYDTAAFVCLITATLLLSACATSPGNSAAQQYSYSEQAVIRDGIPQLAFGDPQGETLNLAYVQYQGEPAMRFAVVYEQSFASDLRGFLYITPDQIAFIVRNDDGSTRTYFNYQKSAVSRFTALGHAHDFDQGLLTDNYGTMFIVSGTDETSLYPLWCSQNGCSTNQQTYLPGAILLKAWAAYGMWINMAWSNFPHAVDQFVKLTANTSVALTADQSTQISALEREADMAAANAQYAKALSDYVAALQVIPIQWAPLSVSQKLEQSAIKDASHLNPAPAVPKAALRHEVYGKTAISNANNAGDLEQGVQELTQAVRLAPWWPDAYYNLAVAQEKAKQYAQAADDLEDYLLARPNAPDANSVQMKIYSLQYEAKHQS